MLAVSGLLGLTLTVIFISDAPFDGALGLLYLGLFIAAGVLMWRSSRPVNPRSETSRKQP